MSNNLSLYIHFPFCAKKCRYCDFYSVPYDPSLVARFIEALKQEWLLICDKYQLSDKLINTVYCGGGTPSLLTVEQWQSFCSEIISNLNLSTNIEWSIECNPDSFTEEKAELWQECGVNRLTLGVQSLHDRELKCLGRIHNVEKVIQVLANPVLKKYASIGVDIMYGIPGQTIESLNSSLKDILSFEHINHLSAYELTLANNTPFGRHKRLLPLPSENEIVEMTELIISTTGNHGLERYEVSNWAKKGCESRHNVAYWNHSPYLGLGPSAHSYLHPQRFSNCAGIHEYIDRLSDQGFPQNFSENLDGIKLEYEIILLGLRTVKGIDENHYRMLTGKKFLTPKREDIVKELVELNYIKHVPPFWRLTDKGFNLADAIIKKVI